MNETMKIDSYAQPENGPGSLDDFALWAQQMAQAGEMPTHGDFDRWEEEFQQADGSDLSDETKHWGEKVGELEFEVEDLDEASLERRVLESPTEPQTLWPEADPSQPVEVDVYLQRCRFRLGNVGHALDVVRDEIATEQQAQEWLQLKMLIEAAKSIDDPYAIVQPMLELEEAGREFVLALNIDMNAYNAVSNK